MKSEMLYCRSCGYEAERWRFGAGGDLEQHELKRGRWFTCPNCGSRMYTHPAGRKRR
jgi:DNA-directed RNA polymerase subunit RPC12/RpoP